VSDYEVENIRAEMVASLIAERDRLAKSLDDQSHHLFDESEARVDAEGALRSARRSIEELRERMLAAEAERDALATQLAQAGRVIDALAANLDWVRTDACALCAYGTCSAHQPAAGVIAALDGTVGLGEEHRYLSTACLHGAEPGREDLHRECKIDTKRYDGTHKIGATCKWCPARCVCTCHAGAGEEGSDG
jgi:hypothetical protein